MDVRLTWTDCDKAGDYVVPNVLSPRDLGSRPDNMDETVLYTIVSCEYLLKSHGQYLFYGEMVKMIHVIIIKCPLSIGSTEKYGTSVYQT